MQGQIDTHALADCLRIFAARGRAIREAQQKTADEGQALTGSPAPAASDPTVLQRQDHEESTP